MHASVVVTNLIKGASQTGLIGDNRNPAQAPKSQRNNLAARIGHQINTDLPAIRVLHPN